MKPFNPLERGVLRDPISISAGIGVGTNLIGGIIGRRSARKAAKTQADAARLAGERLETTAREVNPAILAAAEKAGVGVTTAAGEAATGVKTAAEEAAEQMGISVEQANKLLDPYAQAGAEATGTLQTGLREGGVFNKTPGMEDITIDPGFAFRQAEAQKAIERSAAARGGVLGGGVTRALTRYSQDAASQEYSNAFNRFRAITQDRYNRLFGVSGKGQEAAGTQGRNLLSGTEYSGDIRTGAARYGGDITTDAARYAGGTGIRASEVAGANTLEAARARAGLDTDAAAAIASGQVAGTNALVGGISGATNAVTSALTLRQLLKSPTAPNKFRAPAAWSLPRRFPISLGAR